MHLCQGEIIKTAKVLLTKHLSNLLTEIQPSKYLLAVNYVLQLCAFW